MNNRSYHDSIIGAASKEKQEVPSTPQKGDLDPDPSRGLNDYKRQNLEEAKDKHQLRLNYVKKFFGFVCVWLVYVAFVVLMNGFAFMNFNLSDSVLITLLTATSVKVVGILAIVTQWIFPMRATSKNS